MIVYAETKRMSEHWYSNPKHEYEEVELLGKTTYKYDGDTCVDCLLRKKDGTIFKLSQTRVFFPFPELKLLKII